MPSTSFALEWFIVHSVEAGKPGSESKSDTGSVMGLEQEVPWSLSTSFEELQIIFYSWARWHLWGQSRRERGWRWRDTTTTTPTIITALTDWVLVPKSPSCALKKELLLFSQQPSEASYYNHELYEINETQNGEVKKAKIWVQKAGLRACRVMCSALWPLQWGWKDRQELHHGINSLQL